MNNSIDVSFYLQDLVWAILIKIQYKIFYVDTVDKNVNNCKPCFFDVRNNEKNAKNDINWKNYN